MPHKTPEDRTRAKREWKQVNSKAFQLVKRRMYEQGVNPPARYQDLDPQVMIAARLEVKAKLKAGEVLDAQNPKHFGAVKVMPELPPDLPYVDEGVRLEDGHLFPQELRPFGFRMFLTFLEELKVIGDVQICALKNGLPLHVIMRRASEGEVDLRESKFTWNAMLYRALAQARAHRMAGNLVLLVNKMGPGKDKENQVPHQTQLRAIIEHSRMNFPERFGVRSGSDVFVSTRVGLVHAPTPSSPGPGPAPTANPASPIGADPLVAPTEDDLDEMSAIPLAELQAALNMLQNGDLG